MITDILLAIIVGEAIAGSVATLGLVRARRGQSAIMSDYDSLLERNKATEAHSRELATLEKTLLEQLHTAEVEIGQLKALLEDKREQFRTAALVCERATAEAGAAREDSREIRKMLSEAYAHQRLVLERVVAPAPSESPPALSTEKWVEQLESTSLFEDPRQFAQREADYAEAQRDGGKPHA